MGDLVSSPPVTPGDPLPCATMTESPFFLFYGVIDLPSVPERNTTKKIKPVEISCRRPIQVHRDKEQFPFKNQPCGREPPAASVSLQRPNISSNKPGDCRSCSLHTVRSGTRLIVNFAELMCRRPCSRRPCARRPFGERRLLRRFWAPQASEQFPRWPPSLPPPEPCAGASPPGAFSLP